MQTKDYLASLENDKHNFVTKLNEKGVTLTGNETFTELIPKMDEIKSGGDEDFEINNCNYLFYNDARIEIKDFLLSKCKNVTNANNMFRLSEKIIEFNFNIIDTTELKVISDAFSQCVNLTDVNMDFDMSKITSIGGIFNSDNNLTNLQFGYDLGKGYTTRSNYYSAYALTLSGCPNLTYDSLMTVINGVYDLNLSPNAKAGGRLYPQNLYLGATNLAKLTAEEIAIATTNGWVVS